MISLSLKPNHHGQFTLVQIPHIEDILNTIFQWIYFWTRQLTKFVANIVLYTFKIIHSKVSFSAYSLSIMVCFFHSVIVSKLHFALSLIFLGPKIRLVAAFVITLFYVDHFSSLRRAGVNFINIFMYECFILTLFWQLFLVTF